MQSNETASGISFRKTPILGALAMLSFPNWFVFAGISMYLGGDALGILPSRDGFVLTSHGRHTAVSESAWIFSLYYSSGTLLLTPLIWFLFIARQIGHRWKKQKWPLKLFVSIFLLVWIVGWYSSIGNSFRRSLGDWQKLKHSTTAP